MKIIKHAQSCLEVLTKKANFLIDPGTYVFEDEGKSVNEFSHIDAIIITHPHYDHFDEKNIQELCSIKDVAVFAPSDALLSIKCDNSHEVRDGEHLEFNGAKLVFSQSKHGPLPNGKSAPDVIGVKINDGANSIYSPGDSLYLNTDSGTDVIAVPISGTVTMDADEGAKQVEKLSPRFAIPIHFDNPAYPADPKIFAQKLKNSRTEARVLSWGEYITL
ncbi:MAG: metal-dependent hydrolase [candidate division WS2 bacterium ADurb.Bin280]|uniref:Metal-dependent hydrolase n=1 Tax=candidate division WS2 bacterium ADurb.Bin280 TaxID=1852829 RepID=A0A1V5SCT7_9BACT|nr:MAG: metal-dependent hydrolase [candidate division WS2 bacterium ADurb.Bin280]